MRMYHASPTMCHYKRHSTHTYIRISIVSLYAFVNTLYGYRVKLDIAIVAIHNYTNVYMFVIVCLCVSVCSAAYNAG